MSGAALLMEMRTGKTLVSIALVGRLAADHNLRRILVVCPASVIQVWADQFAQYADYPLTIVPLDHAGKKRKTRIANLDPHPTAPIAAIINYEAVGRSKEVERLIAQWQPELVIADEMHRIKTPGALQSKALRRLGKQARWRLGLSGTPISQSPLDIFGQYGFLDQRIFGTSHTAFKARYALEVPIDRRNPHRKMIVGVKDSELAELTEKTHQIAYQCALADCVDMPTQMDVERYFTMSRDAQEVYKSLVRDSIAFLESDGVVVAQNVLTRMLRLNQLTGGFVTDDMGKVQQVHSGKLDLLGDVLVDVLTHLERKAVVFTRFTAEVDAIHMLAGKLGVECVVLDGRTPLRERGGLVYSFSAGTPRLFIGQIQAAGEGIDLSRADTAIFYSTGYSVKDWDQARSRILGMRVERPATYINLLARDTVDEKILAGLRDRRSLADLITKGWREVIA